MTQDDGMDTRSAWSRPRPDTKRQTAADKLFGRLSDFTLKVARVDIKRPPEQLAMELRALQLDAIELLQKRMEL